MHVCTINCNGLYKRMYEHRFLYICTCRYAYMYKAELPILGRPGVSWGVAASPHVVGTSPLVKKRPYHQSWSLPGQASSKGCTGPAPQSEDCTRPAFFPKACLEKVRGARLPCGARGLQSTLLLAGAGACRCSGLWGPGLLSTDPAGTAVGVVASTVRVTAALAVVAAAVVGPGSC